MCIYKYHLDGNIYGCICECIYILYIACDNICICMCVYYMCMYIKYYISSTGAKYVNYDCHRFPHRFHRVQNVHTYGYPLGPLVPRCAVQWWPMYRVNTCASVVTNAPS